MPRLLRAVLALFLAGLVAGEADEASWSVLAANRARFGFDDDDVPPKGRATFDAAARGSAREQYTAGVMLYDGWADESGDEPRVQVDRERAVDMFRRSAEQGFVPAMHNLALALSAQGRTDEAFLWYERAADEGIPGAQRTLGELLSSGPRRNTKRAFAYTQRACESGMSRVACYSLGTMYHNGLGVPANPKAAQAAWKRAADADHADAIYAYAVTLIQGKQMSDEVWALWERAARLGSKEAMLNLGSKYASEGDMERARAWWEASGLKKDDL